MCQVIQTLIDQQAMFFALPQKAALEDCPCRSGDLQEMYSGMFYDLLVFPLCGSWYSFIFVPPHQ